MKISIPKPCSEDWNQMTTSEKGRFCASCQTQVINFKEMPIEEIKHFLEQKTGSSCGRFSKYQIELFNAAYQELPSPSNIRKWTMAAVLAGVSVLPTFAQDSNPILPAPLLNTSISYYYQSQTTINSGIVPTSDTVILVGHVIDIETEETLPFVNVIIQGTTIGTSTDFDGNFLLKVPKSKEAITLELHYVGYPTLSYSIVPDSTKTDLILKMNGQHLILGNMVGMMIISKKEQKANKRAYKKELREERKRERAALKE
jgi:hypothetical protein